MATNFNTYDAQAIREDLSDVIYDISPTDTPFLSGIAGKGTVSNTYFEWQTDALAAASGTNYHVEGAAVGAATSFGASITFLLNFKISSIIFGSTLDSFCIFSFLLF